MAVPKRNVLLITADQWRGDCLSIAGHPVVKTPHFDALAREGVRFQNHYTVCAPCGPARASLLTGMYMHNHRSVRNGVPLEDRHTNLAREARKAGYLPVLFGYTDTTLDPKVYPHEVVKRHGYESLMPGFEEGLLLPGEHPKAWLEYLQSKGYDIDSYERAFSQPGRLPGQPQALASLAYLADESQTAFLTQKTIEHLGTAEPGWLVHLSWFRPHPPFVAPEPWNTRYPADTVPLPVTRGEVAFEAALHPWVAAALSVHGDWYEPWMQKALGTPEYESEIRQLRATYYGLVSKVDHYFGKLMDCLRESGQLDNTLVVVTSDHGELLGDHHLFGKRGFFDSGFHIPLIIRDPMAPEHSRNQTVDGFSESVDVMPTILDWLGLDIPRQCDGHSLLKAPDADLCRDAALCFWEYDFRNDKDGYGVEQVLGLSPENCVLNVVRSTEHKYVHFSGLPPLFFDLKKDPDETVNLATDAAYRELVMRYTQHLLSWRMLNTAPGLTHFRVSRDGVYSR